MKKSFWVLWQSTSPSLRGEAYADGNAFFKGGKYEEKGKWLEIYRSPWVFDNSEEYGDNDGSLSCATFNSFKEAYNESVFLNQSNVADNHFVPVEVETKTIFTTKIKGL